MTGALRHGDYLWQMANELSRLTSLLVEHHPNARLLVTSFDSGPFSPAPDELACGWARVGSLAISPPLTDGLAIPSAGFDEWYIFDELPGPTFDPEIFVNYVPFPLISGAGPTDELDEWQAEASNRFWRQLIALRPVSYVARADSDTVVSRCEPFVRALSDSTSLAERDGIARGRPTHC